MLLLAFTTMQTLAEELAEPLVTELFSRQIKSFNSTQITVESTKPEGGGQILMAQH